MSGAWFFRSRSGKPRALTRLRAGVCTGLLGAWLLVGGCGDTPNKKGTEERSAASGHEPAGAPKSVELVSASLVAMDEQIEIAGTLAAQDEVTVRSKVAGRLASLAVDLGSVVKTGQAIAQIEAVDYRLRVDQSLAALAQSKALLGLAADGSEGDVVVDETTGVRQARATLDESRAGFERTRQLLERKMIARADFDTANAALLRAESDVQRAREEVYSRLALLKQRQAELGLSRQQLADTTIRSPLDGVVQLRSTTAGEFLAQGAAVATLVSVNPLRLRVEVPERDATRVAVGQTVQVRIDSPLVRGGTAPFDEREQTYGGKIARLSPMLSRQNRTLVVEAELPNPGELRPGSFARAVIALGESEPVIAVPSSALVVFAGIEKVIVVEAGKAIEKKVETGRRSRGMVEIVRGLERNQLVVRVPGTLQQGQPVVVEARGSSARERRVTNERAAENAALKSAVHQTALQ